MDLGPELRREAWASCAERTVAAVGAMNLAVVELVQAIRVLIDTDGWQGVGICSVSHWVRWHAAMSEHRAGNLVRVAERMEELPRCWALFCEGRLSEDAMVRIARRVPPERDGHIAELAPGLLISQLDRVLSPFPVIKDKEPEPKPEPRREVQIHRRADGWGVGRFSLPPDEMARLQVGLGRSREAEYRRRNGLDSDAEVTEAEARTVTTADAAMRLVDEGTDALDPSLRRGEGRDDRTKVVLHHDVDPSGRFGPGQIHLGSVLPDVLARFLACDSEVQVMQYHQGRLVGINPSARTVNRALRRAIERRDQGCTHPLCGQRVALHVHHIEHWEHGGRTIPSNLICLCPRHHRELHLGLFTVEGDPERGPVVFKDQWGRRIEPPPPGSTEPLRIAEPTPYRQPYGERIQYREISWT